MKVTTRDLFNYANPACKYETFLKQNRLNDGELPEGVPEYHDVLYCKQQGTLEGEQVQHERSNDEVDCGE